ncbi:MAG: FAD-binding oxidoreductase [Deltaproteobacteria bacterium]|nr:MAG: FAD-binding oxidoreductase [Deltaproteobacteria bacterium]
MDEERLIALERIVGKGNIDTDPDNLAAYFKSDVKTPNLLLVTPTEDNQVQEIVRFASTHNIPIYTVRDQHCPKEIASNEGIILDSRKMNRVFEVDPINLHAIIGPGVTFSQLISEIKLGDKNLKLALPVAADSHSVLHNYMRRNVTLLSPTLRGRTIIVSNYHVVIPYEGEIFKSGSHSISEEDHVPDWPGTGGTAASIAFYGMDDALGIPIKAVIWLFPVQECRKAVAIGFPDIDKAKLFMQENCRKGRFIEAYAANSLFLAVILSQDGIDIGKARNELPPWIVAGSLEGSEELVAVTREILDESAKNLGGKEIKGDYLEPISSSMERPWYVWDRDTYQGAFYHVPFYTLFRRSSEFDKIFLNSIEEKGYPAGELGQLLIPMKQARSLYCEYDLYFESGKEKEYEEIYNYSFQNLVKAGAFVDRPRGKIAELIYSENPKMWELQKGIKRKLDPAGILNPDQLIAKEL